MRGLNPDQLRTFVEVLETGSFTAAAKRLNLSQPAVSLQIRELEARCGVQLLERLGRKPYPTDAGRKLLVHANRILQENEEALLAMRRLHDADGHRVRVGMTMTTLSYLARDVIRRFKLDNPKIDLSIALSASAALADDVRNRHLDLAIVTLPVDEAGLSVQPYYKDHVVGIVADDTITPPPRVATPELLATRPFIVQSIGDVQTILAQAWFRGSGAAPQSFFEVQTLDACRAAVAAGLGVSIVPGVMAGHPMKGVLHLPTVPPLIREMAIIAHADSTPSANITRVREALLLCRSNDAADAGTGAAMSVSGVAGPRRALG